MTKRVSVAGANLLSTLSRIVVDRSSRMGSLPAFRLRMVRHSTRSVLVQNRYVLIREILFLVGWVVLRAGRMP